MMTEYQVQQSGLAGQSWKTVCRAAEPKAREIYQRPLRLHTVGRFRLVAPDGRVLEEGKATPLFGNN